MAHVSRPLRTGSTALLLCDIQSRFESVVHGFESLSRCASFLVKSASELDLPIIVTEQYPKAFKETIPAIKKILPEKNTKIFEKTLFSMCTPEVKAHLNELGCTSVILCGLETHVCVLQTSLDLLSMGIDVHVCADGVSSQRKFDRSVALSRLATSGAVISTSESLLYQLVVDSKHPKFRALQPFIKENAANSKESELLTF
uniref:Isochorismatase-like domain-containing protein n=1 Tax=Aureoumbra lagunensis TaxID=44058 RepID=A0A7S3JRL0_9STRA